jgi:hypothetical protein
VRGATGRTNSAMTYTLWDTETSNQFGQFEDEKEVLALVRTLLVHSQATSFGIAK